MYQRILVPIDGSTASERALLEAIKLAGSEGQLRLIYVVEESHPLDAEGYTFIDYPALQDALFKTGERTLSEAAQKVLKANIKVETALVEVPGERLAAIIDGEALKWRADLIVIGTHGRSGISRLLLGSVAEGVIRLSSVPVLMLRAE